MSILKTIQRGGLELPRRIIMKITTLFIAIVAIISFSFSISANAQPAAPTGSITISTEKNDPFNPFVGERSAYQKVKYRGSEAQREVILKYNSDGSGVLILGRFDMPGGNGSMGSETEFKGVFPDRDGRIIISGRNTIWSFKIKDGFIVMGSYIAGRLKEGLYDEAVLK
jgi:hypothetical protein